MADENEMLNTIGYDRGSRLMDIAREEYPYLKDKPIEFKYTPMQGEDRQLEFYPPEETQRPEYFPMGKPAIEVFNPMVRPIDILGDYVSHYGVKADPQLQALYGQFTGALDPQIMQQRYQYHQQNFGEKRPYEQWAEMTGVPEMFRGYTFGQWQDAERMYTPAQLNILNQVKKYLGIK